MNILKNWNHNYKLFLLLYYMIFIEIQKKIANQVYEVTCNLFRDVRINAIFRMKKNRALNILSSCRNHGLYVPD